MTTASIRFRAELTPCPTDAPTRVRPAAGGVVVVAGVVVVVAGVRS
jgi:hypothetical protein